MEANRAGVSVVAIALALLICESVAASGLTWQEKRISVSLERGKSTQAFRILFKNTSNKPISIESVQASCGCIQINRPVDGLIDSGEVGELTGLVKTKSLRGTQVKDIVVHTTEGHDILKVELVVPQLVTVTPDRFEWYVGEAPAEQHCVLSKKAEDFVIVSVASTIPSLQLRTEIVNGEKRVIATPTTTDEATRGFIAVSLKGSSGVLEEIRVPALVR